MILIHVNYLKINKEHNFNIWNYKYQHENKKNYNAQLVVQKIENDINDDINCFHRNYGYKDSFKRGLNNDNNQHIEPNK